MYAAPAPPRPPSSRRRRRWAAANPCTPSMMAAARLSPRWLRATAREGCLAVLAAPPWCGATGCDGAVDEEPGTWKGMASGGELPLLRRRRSWHGGDSWRGRQASWSVRPGGTRSATQVGWSSASVPGSAAASAAVRRGSRTQRLVSGEPRERTRVERNCCVSSLPSFPCFFFLFYFLF
jgi:hypothetical protein